MSVVSASARYVLPLLLLLAAGCARVEFSREPVIPDVSMPPAADGTDTPSPPPLAALPEVGETPVVPGDALNLTIEGAIVMALQNNKALMVQELSPAIQQTFTKEQRAVFDPVLSANYLYTRDEFDRDLLIRTPVSFPDWQGGTINLGEVWAPVYTEVETSSETRGATLTQRLPTGTDISIGVSKDHTEVRNKSSNPNQVYGTDTDTNTSSLDFTVRQQLLRGGGLGVNLASLRRAKLAAVSSDYDLRAFTEDLVSQVEQTYWNCMLAQRQITIFENSLAVAQSQADEIEERIRVGQFAESERAAADAEVAQRRSSLIDARSNYDTLRIAFLRLLSPNAESLHPVGLNLLSDPILPPVNLADVDVAILVARRLRPDLNQARLQIQQDDLSVVQTKNGLLPQLDLFLTLSQSVNKTNYKELYLVSSQNDRDERTTTQIGAEFSYPIGNRAARAAHSRSKLSRTASVRALANLSQLVEQDVRSAYVEVERSRQQIDATAATRTLQETTLEVEREKFRLGRSTVLLVSQAQRDLLSAQIAEVDARASYLNALVNLYRLEGSLLERRGVDCPGREPIDIEEERETSPATAGS